MPVMGYTKFERFFRAVAGVDVDRDDIKGYLDFFGGISVALAWAFKLIGVELGAVRIRGWERMFGFFWLLVWAGQAGTTRMVDVPAAARGKRGGIPAVTFPATGGIQWQRFRSAAAGGTRWSSTRPASSRTSTTGWAS